MAEQTAEYVTCLKTTEESAVPNHMFAYIKADNICKLSEGEPMGGGAEFCILNLVGITKPYPYIHSIYLETPVKERNRLAPI